MVFWKSISWKGKYQELFNFQSYNINASIEMVDVVFQMNSDVKTLNFCSPTIEKVLYSNTTSVGKESVCVGGWGGGDLVRWWWEGGADIKRNIPRFC